jgi:Caspase domain
MRGLGAILGFIVLLGMSTASAAPVRRRALVIANNASDVPGLEALKYADDDGVMWTETLQRLGVETTLLVIPDAVTRASRRPVLAGARPPSLEEVRREVAKLRAANLADQASGKQTDVFVIYVGHGNTDSQGRAYFTLDGGRMDQTFLYREVVGALEADFVHVILDACRASGVVGRRGQTDKALLDELQEMIEQGQLAQKSQVGFLFAESQTGVTHEWSEISAGVFSHVARSGLLGGADINADGMVEYSELGAFVTAALKEVKALPARLEVYVSAPARAPWRSLVGPAPPGPSLTVPAGFEYPRISVEDSLGRRLVDVRLADDLQVRLNLPERDTYWVRTPTGEVKLARSQLGAEPLQLRPREEPVRVRGPTEEALLFGLFAIPLDWRFYERYVASSGQHSLHSPRVPGMEIRPPEPWPDSEPSVEDKASSVVALEPGEDTSGRWALGLGMHRAPVEAMLLSVGPSLTWRSQGLFYVGLSGAWATTPKGPGEMSLHRLSLHALMGMQSPGPVAGFLEAAVGGGILAAISQDTFDSVGTPPLFETHAVLGVTMASPVGRVRLGGLLGTEQRFWGWQRHIEDLEAERFFVKAQPSWALTYGTELSLQF